jgi:hypothetical protein
MPLGADASVVRMFWKDPAGPQAFVGAEYDEDGQITPYFTPRLKILTLKGSRSGRSEDTESRPGKRRLNTGRRFR